MPTHSRRFIFHGSAAPFGAHILSIGGNQHLEAVPGPPCSSLSVVGGHHREKSEGSSFRNIFKWGETLAESKGEVRENGHHVTTITSMVQDLYANNDPIEFTAKQLKNVMIADHPPQGQPKISFAEAPVFEGMFLNGEPLQVEFDDDLTKFPTFAEFDKEYRRNEEQFKKYQRSLIRPPGDAKFGERLPRSGSGFVVFSFVRSIHYKKKKIKGHILKLKGFGTIHFGEVLMKENNRRVTLVRMAMGSTTGASAVCSCSDPNGTWTT